LFYESCDLDLKDLGVVQSPASLAFPGAEASFGIVTSPPPFLL